MSRVDMINIGSCHPATRNHEWVATRLDRHGCINRMRCVHCTGEVTGVARCMQARGFLNKRDEDGRIILEPRDEPEDPRMSSEELDKILEKYS